MARGWEKGNMKRNEIRCLQQLFKSDALCSKLLFDLRIFRMSEYTSFIPNPFTPRRAADAPILPAPTIPSVFPDKSEPIKSVGDQPVYFSAFENRSASAIRCARQMIERTCVRRPLRLPCRAERIRYDDSSFIRCCQIYIIKTDRVIRHDF